MTRPTCRQPAGFSMIELLIALAIGIIGSLLMMQIFGQSEGGRRALGALSDSQSNGVIARFTIEREMQQAGLGVVDTKILGCKVRSSGSFNGKLLSPVAIIPAGADAASADNVWSVPPGDAGSDIITVLIGSGAVMPEGTPLVSGNTGNDYPTENTYGLNEGDRIVVGDGSQDCTMGKVTKADPASGTVTLDWGGGLSYSGGAKVFSLGSSARALVYAVRGGRLTVCDFFKSDCANAGQVTVETVWVPVASDVVALVAQYGWDTSAPPDMIADAFCKARLTAAAAACPGIDVGSPGAGNSGLAQGRRACDWTRVPVVRFAVVTRSGQYEKEEVSPATIKLWPDSAVVPTTTGPSFSPTATDPDGRHYRYRVTYSQAALRNVIWAKANPSC